jgi:hypothetical protein
MVSTIFPIGSFYSMYRYASTTSSKGNVLAIFAELLRPRCQPTALVISEPQAPIANLFAESPIFLYQIIDHLLLVD